MQVKPVSGSEGIHHSPDHPQIPEKLKRRLYPEVLALFSNYDFHKVNIREISRKSKVSTGTIYKYFSSKEELIFTILDEEISKINILISSHITGMADTKEIFRKIFWLTMDFYDHHPGVAITAFITVPMRTWMQDKTYRRQDDLSILKQHIAEAKARKEIDRNLSLRQIMDSYYMICYRCIHNWYFEGMTYRLTDKIDEYFNIFVKIIAPLKT